MNYGFLFLDIPLLVLSITLNRISSYFNKVEQPKVSSIIFSLPILSKIIVILSLAFESLVMKSSNLAIIESILSILHSSLKTFLLLIKLMKNSQISTSFSILLMNSDILFRLDFSFSISVSIYHSFFDMDLRIEWKFLVFLIII